jgi:hypothetical protein
MFRLVIAFTCFYLLALFASGIVILRAIPRSLITAILVGSGTASLPSLLFRGYGHWQFEGSPLAVRLETRSNRLIQLI